MHDQLAVGFEQAQRALAHGDVGALARQLYEHAAQRAKLRAEAVKVLRRASPGSPAT